MATVDLKKIDGDSHFLPQSNFGNVRDLLPGYPQETLDMILRDAAVFANPNARSGGFRAPAAGQRTGGGFPEVSQGAIASKRSGPIGHGQDKAATRDRIRYAGTHS